MAEIPSMERYRDKLKVYAHSMPHVYRQLLLKHYRAPDHTATATELAKFVDFKDYSAVNLHYGTFAAELARRMDWPIPPDAPAASFIATFEKSDDDEAHWKWVMRPQVAGALEALGWVNPPWPRE
jgi:hypothetical protein